MGLPGLPLVLFLIIFGASLGHAEPLPVPPQATQSDAPSKDEQPLLREVFQGQFSKDQLTQFGEKHPTLKNLTGLMSPDQKEGARVRLRGLETNAATPADREQIAEGYLLLGSSVDAIRIISQLLEENPQNVKAYHLTSEAQYHLRNFPAAAEAAQAALKINPNDRVALAHWMLAKGRIDASKVTLPTDPFGKKEGGGDAAQGLAGSHDRNQSVTAVVAKSVLADLPTSPAPVDTEPIPKDASLADISRITFTAAATAIGGLLLFVGLGAGKLEEKFPNIRRNTGIAIGVAGALAVGAHSLPTLLPLVLSNPQLAERGRNAVVAAESPQGQRLLVQAEQQLPRSVAQGARLKEHLRLLQSYGQAGCKALEDGRIRYYQPIDPADKFGVIKGRRFVREWNPLTNTYRDWMENVDRLGRVRILHPKTPPAPHYMFDEAGKHIGQF